MLFVIACCRGFRESKLSKRARRQRRTMNEPSLVKKREVFLECRLVVKLANIFLLAWVVVI